MLGAFFLRQCIMHALVLLNVSQHKKVIVLSFTDFKDVIGTKIFKRVT